MDAEYEQQPDSDQETKDTTARYLAVAAPLGLVAAGLGYIKHGQEFAVEAGLMASTSIVGLGLAIRRVFHSRQQG